jgi:tetratricopeptide (TPR) repeat protein
MLESDHRRVAASSRPDSRVSWGPILEDIMTNEAADAIARAVMLLNNAAYVSAIKACDDAIGRNRGCAAAFYMRALARRAEGDHARAADDFGQGAALAPAGSLAWAANDATALYHRGSAYHNERDLDRAINNYSAAIKLDPRFARALLNRAVALQARDRNNPRGKNYDERFGGVPDCERAIDDYRAVLSLDADDGTKRSRQADGSEHLRWLAARAPPG